MHGAVVSYAEHLVLVSHAVHALVSDTELAALVSHAEHDPQAVPDSQHQAAEHADLTHPEAELDHVGGQGGAIAIGKLTPDSSRTEAALLLS